MRHVLFAAIACCCLPLSAQDFSNLPELSEFSIKSSLDKTQQPSLMWAPKTATEQPAVLFVFLHSWSSGYRQNNAKWLDQAVKRNWIYLHPNFRGRNDHPEACGSKLARQDILDAMDYVIANYKVDQTRIYLAGVSGGGHMTMLMAGHHPDRFTAASAWVGISNLVEWYRFHSRGGKPTRYANMIAKSLQGPPGTSKAVDEQYRDRSPLFHLHNATKLPLDINAGVKDGKTGSVPIMHALNAFNVVARAGRHDFISDTEIDELWKNERLSSPQPSDTKMDVTLGREIRLRRTAGKARVTIFDGGHESVPQAACEWLKQHRQMLSTD